MQSRVIRIDNEVWAELQRRACPFEDTPNTVLRKVLGLTVNAGSNDDSGGNVMNIRVSKLITLVGGAPLVVQSITSDNDIVSILSNHGTKFGYIYPQRRRLKVEIRKDWAVKAGLTGWDHWLENGWFNAGPSVYWYLPDEDIDAYKRVANILATLRIIH